MSVRFGILSTARINELVLAGARESELVEVAAVASRDQARADEYAREHSIPRAHGSYEELLADPELDAVYISLPNSLHVEWSIKALEAGKHVLCEKPLSRRLDDVERAFDTAVRTGLLFTEAFMYRHNPQTARLTELVDSGAIGELCVVRAAFTFPLSDPANVRLASDLDGGALMDVGCYCVSGSRLLAGEPERVFGVATIESGVDVQLVGTMSFPGTSSPSSTAASSSPAATSSRRSAPKARSSSTIRGTPGSPSSSFAEQTASRRSSSSRSIPTGWSWRISPTRSRAGASCCSAGKTRSVKPARSTRSIARPRRARP